MADAPALDHYHLLQVPRVAMMLTLVVIMLIGTVVAANQSSCRQCVTSPCSRW